MSSKYKIKKVSQNRKQTKFPRTILYAVKTNLHKFEGSANCLYKGEVFTLWHMESIRESDIIIMKGLV